jgi:hypothetical protein
MSSPRAPPDYVIDIECWFVTSITTASLSWFEYPIDDSQYTPGVTRRQQDPGQPGESDVSDRSGSLFSMFLNRAREQDEKRAELERWHGYADGILLFVRLPLLPSVLLNILKKT